MIEGEFDGEPAAFRIGFGGSAPDRLADPRDCRPRPIRLTRTAYRWLWPLPADPENLPQIPGWLLRELLDQQGALLLSARAPAPSARPGALREGPGARAYPEAPAGRDLPRVPFERFEGDEREKGASPRVSHPVCWTALRLFHPATP